jgi:sulfide:quinone oxidoreductase
LTRLIAARKPNPPKVVIVGGGIAALEALLALRHLAGSAVEIQLVAPEPEFVYQPTSVAEPFGLGGRRAYDLGEIVRDQGAELVRDSFAALDPDRRIMYTHTGAEIEYGSLLLAIGAKRTRAIPGALTFRGSADSEAFGALLARLEAGEVRRLLFAVPPAVRWPLALYELALLTAAHLAGRGVREVDIGIVTHEPAPLSLFGDEASDSVVRLLSEAGVTITTDCAAEAAEDGGLRLRDGRRLLADAVVALPKLSVPDLAGVPQGPEGFIPTSDHGVVEGLVQVYAAGDATWFPIKQGGVAAQQADAAAAAIAASAGVHVKREQHPQPVLRGLLLTGDGPHYLRSSVGERDATSAAGPDPLWWPPAKVAGHYLAPYLARDELDRPLEDLEAVAGEPGHRSEAHSAAFELALTAADANASWGDNAEALRWLVVAEHLNVVLPPEYAEKRRRWERSSSRARS